MARLWVDDTPAIAGLCAQFDIHCRADFRRLLLHVVQYR